MLLAEITAVDAHFYSIGTNPRPTEKALWKTSMTTGGVVRPERNPIW